MVQLDQVARVNISLVVLTPELAQEIFAANPRVAFASIGTDVIRHLIIELRAGKWPKRALLFNRDGSLFRGHTMVMAVMRSKISVPVTIVRLPARPPVNARAKARAEGKTRYFDGKPCKHGHLGERLTSSTQCVECKRIRRRERWQICKLGKKLREDKFGFDPQDLRCRRKERGIKTSDRPVLVRIREKRRLFGRSDRLKKPNGSPESIA